MENIIIRGDCLKEMRKIKDNSIDMILCDLPYGTTRNKWDLKIDLRKLWIQYERIIKSNGAIVLTAQTPFDKVLGNSNLKLLRYEWIWIKSQGTGHLNAKKMPLKNYESVLVFYKSLPTYNPQMIGTERRTKKRSGKGSKSTNYGKFKEIRESEYKGRYPVSTIKFKKETGLHPTQKPTKLFEYLIRTYTNKGEIVLDNCAGSGTTAIACINTDRKYILIEKKEKYIEVIENRIKKQS